MTENGLIELVRGWIGLLIAIERNILKVYTAGQITTITKKNTSFIPQLNGKSYILKIIMNCNKEMTMWMKKHSLKI